MLSAHVVVYDTDLAQKAWLICVTGPTSSMIGGTPMRASPVVRETRACVCVCNTLRKYVQADKMTDGGTYEQSESGDSRDTTSHSPTHISGSTPSLLFLSHPVCFPFATTSLRFPSLHAPILHPCYSTLRIPHIPYIHAYILYDGIARVPCSVRQLRFSSPYSWLRLFNTGMHTLGLLNLRIHQVFHENRHYFLSREITNGKLTRG